MSFWGNPIRLDVRPTNPLDTDVSTVETVHQMIALARISAASLPIHSIVDSLVRKLPAKPSDKDIARAIWWWVKNHITFVTDEEILASEMGYSSDPHQELLIAPVVLLAMPRPMGDCDDFAMLTASLLIAAGLPAWYVAIAVDEDQPWRYSHIYVKTWLADDGEFYVMDVSHGQYAGWETKREMFRRMEWQVV